MPVATSLLETQSASRYLQQMSKHFAHKMRVEYTETRSEASMPGGGVARMSADDEGLTVTLVSDDPAVIALSKQIIESHLARFAFREAIDHLEWVDSDK